MATGYTAIIEEMGDVTFEEFVWRCARAMGALVMMRDESLGAPIPERFEPSDHYARSIKRARARLASVQAMTPEECEREAEKEHEVRSVERVGYCERNRHEDERYHEMIAKVSDWKPPTKDHEGLKAFMLEQLHMSLHGDGWAPPPPRKLSGPEWRERALRSAREDIESSERHHREEVERTESRNQWLAQLRQSVPPPKVAP